MNDQHDAAFVAVVLLLWITVFTVIVTLGLHSVPQPKQIPDGPFFEIHYHNPVREA